jgi:hypothetical protein
VTVVVRNQKRMFREIFGRDVHRERSRARNLPGQRGASGLQKFERRTCVSRSALEHRRR